MKTYLVTLVEKLTYHIEVEANSIEEAEQIAYESDKFNESLIDDNDTDCTEVKLVDKSI